MTSRIPEIAQILLGIAAGAPIRISLATPNADDNASARKIILMTIRTAAYVQVEQEERLGYIESRLRTCLTANKTASAWVTRTLTLRDGLARLAGYFTQAYQATAAATTS